MAHAPHHLPTVADIVELAGSRAFSVARARLHAAIATRNLIETEHYSAMCRDLIAGGWARPTDTDTAASF